jgi:hypothetical protein
MRKDIRLATLAASMAVALTGAGCGHMPVSTMWALRSFDSLAVDPAFLRAAVRIPDGLLPRPGGVKVTATWGRKGEPATERKVEIALQEASLSAEGPALTKERRAGAHLYVFRVPPDDVPRLRALQAEVARAKSVGAANYGSIGVSADACRTRDLSAGPAYLTTFLKVSEETGWLTLLEDVDLRTQVSAEKPLDDLAPPCEKLPNRVEPAAG